MTTNENGNALCDNCENVADYVCDGGAGGLTFGCMDCVAELGDLPPDERGVWVRIEETAYAGGAA